MLMASEFYIFGHFNISIRYDTNLCITICLLTRDNTMTLYGNWRNTFKSLYMSHITYGIKGIKIRPAGHICWPLTDTTNCLTYNQSKLFWYKQTFNKLDLKAHDFNKFDVCIIPPGSMNQMYLFSCNFVPHKENIIVKIFWITKVGYAQVNVYFLAREVLLVY